MAERATDRIMHARMRNAGVSAKGTTGVVPVTRVLRNRDLLRQRGKVRQGSSSLVTPAALPASARIVKTKTNHERGDQAPTTDDMAFDGRK